MNAMPAPKPNSNLNLPNENFLPFFKSFFSSCGSFNT